ncbi:MAG: hypothetical protein WKF57_03460 [Nakamurella sp.]
MDLLPHLGPDDVAAVPWPVAVEAIARAAVTDHAGGPARSAVPLVRGEFLLMPAESPDAVGIKVLTIAPDNPALGVPRIQGVYLVFDQHTLTPRALLDGPALTELRTAAVSTHGILQLAPPDRTPGALVVFGSGPQAVAHVRALDAVRPPTGTTLIARDATGLERAVSQLGELSGPVIGIVADRRAAVAEAVRGAEVVVCATTARTPLFDGSWLADDALVVAVGSHEPVSRELDAAVFARAAVVLVEDVPTALREAGDVILAVQEGVLEPGSLLPLAARVPAGIEGPRVFKSVGMAWEDLAIAGAVLARR